MKGDDDMFDRRLKQIRLARGYTLEELAAKTGGFITKQALSKYEKGKIRPSALVLNKLAEALNTKAATLYREPSVSVEIIAFRKASRLPKKELARIESYVKNALEERIQLQELAGLSVETLDEKSARRKNTGNRLPVQAMPIKNLEDVETAAETLRSKWNLGLDEISNMTETLENHSVHVIDISTKHKLDGVAAVALVGKNQVKAAAVANKTGVPGERQRLNLAHELGHLVLDIPKNVDEEKAAFRFGAAFIAPSEIILNEVGTHRSSIQLEEFFMLKRRFGLSIAALMYRLRNLNVISESYYRRWCIEINKLGWKQREPNEIKTEQSNWLRRVVLRSLSEGFLTAEEAARFLGESVEHEEPFSLIEKKAFLKLPLEERRKLLAEQAAKLSSVYNENPDVDGIGGGDFD